MPTNAGSRQLWVRGMLDTLPLSLAVIPWGILTGALAIKTGMTPLQGQLMSLLVFAGAAQLSAMTLLAGSASLGAIYGSTFVISARHLLYSVTFREHVLELPLRWRLAIAFVLTDEMFAVSQDHVHRTGQFSAIYALVSGFTFYLVWNIATLVGIVLGDSLQNLESLGLDFVIIAIFISMTFDQIRRYPVAVAIIVSGVSAVLLKPFISDSYIVVAALSGMLAAYLVSDKTDIGARV